MIVAGFGFRGAATVRSLRDAYARAASGHAVTHLAAPDDKARAHVFREFAQSLDLPVVPVSPTALIFHETETRSERVFLARGTGSVAEAAALSATGGQLLRARCVSEDRMATCAIAAGETR